MTGPAVAPPGGSGAPGAPPAGGGWGSGAGGATLTIQPETEARHGYPVSNIPPAPAPPAPPAPPAGAAPVPGAPAPAAQPAPSAQTVPLGPNTILDGPGIPPELRGKSFSEVMGIYGSMRQVVLRVADQGGMPAAAPPAADRGQPAPPAAPAAPAAPGAAPTGPTKEDFWRDPIGSLTAALIPKIDERINAAVEPFKAGAVDSTIQQVRQQIGIEFPDFAAYEPAVREMLKGANPEQLANAELWRTAYWVSKGRATQPPAAGAPPAANGAQPPAAPAAPAPPATRYPPQPVVGGGQPVPNMSSFFSEAPQAPNNAAGAASLTPSQLAVAAAMNMSPDQYVAWKGGVAR